MKPNVTALMDASGKEESTPAKAAGRTSPSKKR